MSGQHGRLSILNQLATIQHYGAPTRLIDVSFNAWIGTWFVVEQQLVNGGDRKQGVDGRVFAIDVTDTLINEDATRRTWEDDLQRPWRKGHPWSETMKGSDTSDAKNEFRDRYKEWCTTVFAWRPSHFFNRIAAQNGGFIMGGAPLSTGPRDRQHHWPHVNGGYWSMQEVRNAMSVAVHPNQLGATRGRISLSAVYTIRISATAKSEIRRRLKSLFGYEHRTIYPDFSGFAQFGISNLRQSPPET